MSVKNIDSLQVKEHVPLSVKTGVDLPVNVQEWQDMLNEIKGFVPKTVLLEDVVLEVEESSDYDSYCVSVACYYWRAATQQEKDDYMVKQRAKEERQRKIDLDLYLTLKEQFSEEEWK